MTNNTAKKKIRLKSETNTFLVQREIEELAQDKWGDNFISAFFEHDQWFVEVEDEHGDYEAWAVVDCAHGCGYGFTDLDFEAL